MNGDDAEDLDRLFTQILASLLPQGSLVDGRDLFSTVMGGTDASDGIGGMGMFNGSSSPPAGNLRDQLDRTRLLESDNSMPYPISIQPPRRSAQHYGQRQVFRRLPDGRTETETTITHADGTRETVVTRCDARQEFCDTVRTWQLADGSIQQEEPRLPVADGIPSSISIPIHSNPSHPSHPPSQTASPGEQDQSRGRRWFQFW